MKPTKKYSTTAVLLVMMATLFTGQAALAQRYSARPRPFIGIEGTMGTRTFGFDSDIETVVKKTLSSGASSGLIFGNRFFQSKLKGGFYQSSETNAQLVRMIETEGIVSVHPLAMLFPKGQADIYLVAGVTHGTVKLSGTYTPPAKPVEEEKKEQCTCTCPTGGGLPADPDQMSANASTSAAPSDPMSDPDAEAETSEKEPFSGNANTTRATVGGGIQIRFPGKTRFVNLFAEFRYGAPLSTISKEAALANTKGTSMVAIEVGFRYGLGFGRR